MEVINIDAYLKAFIANNYLFLALIWGLLKAVAKLTPWAGDDKIVTMLSGVFSEAVRKKSDAAKTAAVALCAMVMLGTLPACSGTQQKTAYQGLDVSATMYETAMGTVADLYRQGIVDDEAKAKAIELGTYYHSAYHAAVDALEAAAVTGSATDSEKARTALAELERCSKNFVAYIRPILEAYYQREVADGK